MLRWQTVPPRRALEHRFKFRRTNKGVQCPETVSCGAFELLFLVEKGTGAEARRLQKEAAPLLTLLTWPKRRAWLQLRCCPSCRSSLLFVDNNSCLGGAYLFCKVLLLLYLSILQSSVVIVSICPAKFCCYCIYLSCKALLLLEANAIAGLGKWQEIFRQLLESGASGPLSLSLQLEEE